MTIKPITKTATGGANLSATLGNMLECSGAGVEAAAISLMVAVLPTADPSPIWLDPDEQHALDKING